MSIYKAFMIDYWSVLNGTRQRDSGYQEMKQFSFHYLWSNWQVQPNTKIQVQRLIVSQGEIWEINNRQLTDFPLGGYTDTANEYSN